VDGKHGRTLVKIILSEKSFLCKQRKIFKEEMQWFQNVSIWKSLGLSKIPKQSLSGFTSSISGKTRGK
jgi:hypothetical protein